MPRKEEDGESCQRSEGDYCNLEVSSFRLHFCVSGAFCFSSMEAEEGRRLRLAAERWERGAYVAHLKNPTTDRLFARQFATFE